MSPWGQERPNPLVPAVKTPSFLRLFLGVSLSFLVELEILVFPLMKLPVISLVSRKFLGPIPKINT